MLEQDKNLTADAFGKPAEDKNKCIILVAINAYGMDIKNPDVKLIIQWNLPLLFDPMIQHMGRARKKGGTSAFILLTPKQTRVKDPDEIEKIINSIFSTSANAQLLDSNWPKALPKNSSFSQMLNVEEEKLSDLKSVAGLECDFKLDKEVNLFSKILASNANQNQKQQKKKKQSNLTDAVK